MTSVAQSGVTQRRHRRLVDRALQGRLIGPLLAFEIILFAAAMVFVYFRLEAVIDGQLYRVHAGAGGGGGLPPVLSAVLEALPGILLPNIIVIGLVARRWRDNVQDVVNRLDSLFEAVASLDLSPRQLHTDAHDVLARAELWHIAQRTRCTALRQTSKQLSSLSRGGISGASDLEALRKQLQQIRRLTG